MLTQLAAFACSSSLRAMSEAARSALKLRILDGLGCALGALDGPPVRAVRSLLEELGEIRGGEDDGLRGATLVGGGRVSPDRAALYNGALVRYLDFNDAYLAPRETCHPSDLLGPVLAAAEFAGSDGAELLAALAVAYQVFCRLCDVAPVRARGFDHTTLGSYAAAAGVSRALRLPVHEAANAIAIAGTALNALRVTRTGALSQWKGLAAPFSGAAATSAAFLARAGVTGPREVFEGHKGFMDGIAGRFEIDWSSEDLERVNRTLLKRYDAEIHAQSAIEAILELRDAGVSADDVRRIDIAVFDVAYQIIGGGEEGDKTVVREKEQADHSLPYMVAVALLDGQLLPEQYAPARIVRADVQSLLHKVFVRPDAALSRRFPEEHACRVRVERHAGPALELGKRDYEGFPTRPMRYPTVRAKVDRLAAPFLDGELREGLCALVMDLEHRGVGELTAVLAKARRPEPQAQRQRPEARRETPDRRRDKRREMEPER